MESNTFQFRPQVESLEEKNAPSQLVLTLPAHAAATPAVAVTLPDGGAAGIAIAATHSAVVSVK